MHRSERLKFVRRRMRTKTRKKETGARMHVLMLGWEFPPIITGGLGTACAGLTRALDRRGTKVTFVLPKAAGGHSAKHVSLLSPQNSLGPVGTHEIVEWEELPAGGGEKTRGRGRLSEVLPSRRRAPFGAAAPPDAEGSREGDETSVTFLGVESTLRNPYQRPEEFASPLTPLRDAAGEVVDMNDPVAVRAAIAYAEQTGRPLPPEVRSHHAESHAPAASDYDGDMIGQVERYARFCLAATRHRAFDVIHAHDWMTYPAGIFIAQATGKPLIVHVHSTEFDRSGEHINQAIYDIERRGMHGAMRVVTVSQLTKNLVVRRYGVPEHKIDVVYNGVELEPQNVGITGIRPKDKIVLYFGRITYQKGPEYFVHAARRVLELMPDVRFVVAGSGDQAKRMIELAADLGIGHKVLFTGFLRGDDITRVFNLADLYVMPSVSEPFGIAPLEAMSHNVPVLISKSSGVSEVLTHALKVDFWDIDDMANKIVAVLKYPPLRRTLQEHGAFEVRGLTWDGAAERCEQIYRAVRQEMSARAVARR